VAHGPSQAESVGFGVNADHVTSGEVTARWGTALRRVGGCVTWRLFNSNSLRHRRSWRRYALYGMPL